jgi:hypothetical protein
LQNDEIAALRKEVSNLKAQFKPRSSSPLEILFPWPDGPDFYRSGAAREDTRGSFREQDLEKFVPMQNTC